MNRTHMVLLFNGLIVVMIGTALASCWSPVIALGVLAGGVWNLASLWCFMHLLEAWMGPRPSRARAVAWLVAKFPLMYLAVLGLFSTRTISLLGFSLGFTAVLALALAWFARQARASVRA